jgi:opacity protein-like surface antigen
MFDADFSEASSIYQGNYTGDINDPATWSYVEGSGNTIINDPVEYSESEGSFSMGVGVGFYFKDRYVFNIEYKNLVQSLPVGDSDTTLRINGVTLGVNYSF